ncbi:uncharacterized protein NECHADRAFT_88867 [Fusarium vanettenii 77-13-4]|uniref:Uncharacterized protein n=1 Tax=Fusarium vanettenii (strain ATCC MYA-4622 / CBS 123669 / FGSC 9596 / NRRL 45880 / 77-13-4) TaxID=660122 RepID=C7ZN51_FUSV7|nr:uncharacterized protein NECHADRAFT_88867 [Fusarium vanettenii 77-13-4]EEU34574.1 predicted protein [Fusarium vanettenii 77-13-4]
MPTTASSRSYRALVPEPYNQSDDRSCGHLVRIHKACGRWPWELVQGLTPERWGESAAEKLALAVERVYLGPSSITRSELTERLMTEIRESRDRQITHKICADPASFQKRTLRTSISSTGEGRPIKQSRKANTKAQRGHVYQEHVRSSGRATDPDPVLDADPGPDPDPVAHTEVDRDPEPDPSMDMNLDLDLDMDLVNPVDVPDTNNTGTSVGESRNAKDDEALEESILRLEAAHSRLENYENELRNERQACTSLDIMIANAEKAIGIVSKQRDDAIQQVLIEETDLTKMKRFAMNLSENMRVSMNKSIEDTGRALSETVKKRDSAEKNLQMKQKGLNQQTNARKTTQCYINLLPRFISLCKNEINTEKENQKILFLRRDLRSLDPEGLSRIFDAGLSQCLELMVKIQEEKI